MDEGLGFQLKLLCIILLWTLTPSSRSSVFMLKSEYYDSQLYIIICWEQLLTCIKY